MYGGLLLNLYTSVFGCDCGFGFEQKFWRIDGFGKKKKTDRRICIPLFTPLKYGLLNIFFDITHAPPKVKWSSPYITCGLMDQFPSISLMLQSKWATLFDLTGYPSSSIFISVMCNPNLAWVCLNIWPFVLFVLFDFLLHWCLNERCDWANMEQDANGASEIQIREFVVVSECEPGGAH